MKIPQLYETFDEAADVLAATGVASADPLAVSLHQARMHQETKFLAALSNRVDLPSVASTQDFNFDGLSLRRFTPFLLDDSKPPILYVRGGGWWYGTLDTHERTMRLIASISRRVVFGVDYTRTPEAHYPVQKNQVIAAAGNICDHFSEHGKLVLFGESAGATLALSAAQELRDYGSKSIVGLVLFYGNYAGPQPSKRAYSQWVWHQYLGTLEPSVNPYAIPLFGSMEGLPVIWLCVGERDALLSDTLALTDKLHHAKSPFTLTRYPGLPHGFVMWSAWVRPALEAIVQACNAAAKMH
jgi:acetyl esterase